MKVDNPRFDLTGRGEVASCSECPLDLGIDDTTLCMKWWYGDGNTKRICPTAANYQDACLLAKQANEGAADGR